MKNTFPWGIYIGELNPQNDSTDTDSIPVLLPKECGGFRVAFDEQSEEIANNFIETVVLLLTKALPPKMLNIHLFDFGTAPRFRFLSQFKNYRLYHLYGNTKSAQTGFDHIEDIARHRLHEMLPPTVEHLYEYNANAIYPESYHLLLINLSYFPDDFIGKKRIKSFFDNSYKAGIYVIAYHGEEEDHEISNNKRQANLKYLYEKFSPLAIHNKEFTLTKEVFEFAELQKKFDYSPADCNRNNVLNNITHALNEEEQSGKEVDFLQVPIAKSQDSRQDIYFCLGAKSQNYHAIITGGTGSGKSVLLNNLILGIAQLYTAQQVKLYLMDYKGGIEFAVFRDHPNCEKLFLDAKDKALASEMVSAFAQEQRQRREILAQNKVKSVDAYNKVNADSPLPHKILIIDEAQCLFQSDYKHRKQFTENLDQVTRQGRSDGLHIILVTQTLVGSDIPKEIMGQIPLRLSFKLNEEKDAWTLFESGNTVALNLDKQKHEILINTDRGRKSANLIARANPPIAPDEKEIETIEKTLRKIRKNRSSTDSVQPEIVNSKKLMSTEGLEKNLFIVKTDKKNKKPDWLNRGE